MIPDGISDPLPLRHSDPRLTLCYQGFGCHCNSPCVGERVTELDGVHDARDLGVSDSAAGFSEDGCHSLDRRCRKTRCPIVMVVASAICVAISDTVRSAALQVPLCERGRGLWRRSSSFVMLCQIGRINCLPVPTSRLTRPSSSYWDQPFAKKARRGPLLRSGSGQSVIDLAPKAVSDLEFVLVVPDSEAATSQVLGQWPDNLILVLGGVRDEHVEVGAQFGPSSACTSSTAWRYFVRSATLLAAGRILD